MEADGFAEVCASRRSDIPANPVGHEDGRECHSRRCRVSVIVMISKIGELTSHEGHERGAVDNYSCHLDYISSASSPSILKECRGCLVCLLNDRSTAHRK
jgi:hypothetical protein